VILSIIKREVDRHIPAVRIIACSKRHFNGLWIEELQEKERGRQMRELTRMAQQCQFSDLGFHNPTKPFSTAHDGWPAYA
jgi:hypothetical protein